MVHIRFIPSKRGMTIVARVRTNNMFGVFPGSGMAVMATTADFWCALEYTVDMARLAIDF